MKRSAKMTAAMAVAFGSHCPFLSALTGKMIYPNSKCGTSPPETDRLFS